MRFVSEIVASLRDPSSVKSWKQADEQREEAASHILSLWEALKSAIGSLGVIDNDATMRREVWHDGRVMSWTSAAMVESDRKYDSRIAPFGTYPCSRLANKASNPVSAQSPTPKL